MRTRRSHALLVPFLLACAPLALASPGPDTGDLVVNGEVIPEAAVRREMVYRLGTRALETRKLRIFVEREMEARGIGIADLLEEGEVEEVVEEGRKRLKEEYGDAISEDEVLRNNKLTPETWHDQTRLTLLFNRLFLPENPDDWPELTVAAIQGSMEEGESEMFLAKMREGFKAREEAGTLGNPNDQQRMMFNAMLGQMVVAALDEAANIRTASDGIPADVAMIVDGVEITTDEIFDRIERDLAPIEWERTRRWLAKTTAVRQALKAKDAYLSDEEFAKVWGELNAKYENSILPLEQLALAFKKFPSIDAYRLYRRGLESYRKLIEDEITDEALTAHLDRANRLMGLEQVDCEVILLSAYDFRLAEWKQNGWEEAAKRATEVARRLSEGESWDVLLEEYSDYWDPPIPQSQRAQAAQNAQNRRNQGRFGLRNRNALMPLVDENEYLVFLNGSSVADAIFFDQEAGTVGGPYRGAFGYYITKVNGRTPAAKSFSLDVPTQRESIEQDYLQVRFIQFAEEAMANADIQGL